MSALNDLFSQYLTFMKRMRSGLQAQTVQPYTEVNSKFGVQYETAFYNPSLAAGATSNILIRVGSKPMAIKDIQLQFNSEVVAATLYRDPILLWLGSPLAVYNLNDGNAVAGEALIYAGTTVSANGTQVSPTVYSLGTTNQGNRVISSVASGVGVERILSPNADYLYSIVNEDAVPSAISGIATWYQGDLDYPE